MTDHIGAEFDKFVNQDSQHKRPVKIKIYTKHVMIL